MKANKITACAAALVMSAGMIPAMKSPLHAYAKYGTALRTIWLSTLRELKLRVQLPCS